MFIERRLKSLDASLVESSLLIIKLFSLLPTECSILRVFVIFEGLMSWESKAEIEFQGRNEDVYRTVCLFPSGPVCDATLKVQHMLIIPALLTVT